MSSPCIQLPLFSDSSAPIKSPRLKLSETESLTQYTWQERISVARKMGDPFYLMGVSVTWQKSPKSAIGFHYYDGGWFHLHVQKGPNLKDPNTNLDVQDLYYLALNCFEVDKFFNHRDLTPEENIFKSTWMKKSNVPLEIQNKMLESLCFSIRDDDEKSKEEAAKELRHRAQLQKEVGNYYLLKEGKADYTSKEAYLWLWGAANKGDAEAQYEISQIYVSVKDKGRAFKWCEKAAHNGSKEAAFNLGKFFAKAKNFEEADKWFICFKELSGEEGPLAINWVINFCKQRNLHQLTFKWHERLAAQGNVESIAFVARAFETGIGTERNSVKAIQLYKQAGTFHHDEAFFKLATIYFEGILVEPSLQRVEKYFIKWFNDQSSEDKGESALRIGEFYENRTKGEQEEKLALEWFKTAVEWRNRAANFKLGILYEQGKGAIRDRSLSQKFFESYAFNKPNYCGEIGDCFATGSPLVQNFKRAMHWYQTGIKGENPNIHCQFMLGLFNVLGIGTDVDTKQGIELLERAVLREHQQAVKYVNLIKSFHADLFSEVLRDFDYIKRTDITLTPPIALKKSKGEKRKGGELDRDKSKEAKEN